MFVFLANGCPATLPSIWPTVGHGSQLLANMLAQFANVNEHFLPKRNGKYIKYEDLISKLNTIVLGQYLIRTKMAIEPQDIKELQNSDQYLKNKLKTHVWIVLGQLLDFDH